MAKGNFRRCAAHYILNNGEPIERHRLSIFSENFSQQFLRAIAKISCLQSPARVANEPRAVFISG
jgi:hypothetical protein